MIYYKLNSVMSEHIRLKKGLDIPIRGEAVQKITKTIVPDIIAVKPTDFRGLIPKLEVKEGDRVKAGSALFCDKMRPEIHFCSPCSGIVESIVRGEKRKLLEVRVKADSNTEYIQFDSVKIGQMGKEQVTQLLLERGLWPCIKQRPYGIVANPADQPKAIFISGMDTAPLAGDMDFILNKKLEYLQTAIDAISKLTKGGIRIGLNAKTYAGSDLHKLKGVIYHTFLGPHPAGNVGVQINCISPINKGEVVWTIDMPLLAAIGKSLTEGKYDMSRVIAITGPRVNEPSYVNGIAGMSMKSVSDYFDKGDGDVRIVSGNVLTGDNVGIDGYLGFFHNQITAISEGHYCEMFGWAKPFRLKKFSFSHSYWSWLCSKKKYDMDTNINGGVRAFVLSNVYSKVLPMDIYPTYLFKAILAGDIEKMENLGIYEILEEDVALCEYVDPSKIEIQSIVTQGIDLMLKEMA